MIEQVFISSDDEKMFDFAAESSRGRASFCCSFTQSEFVHTVTQFESYGTCCSWLKKLLFGCVCGRLMMMIPDYSNLWLFTRGWMTLIDDRRAQLQSLIVSLDCILFFWGIWCRKIRRTFKEFLGIRSRISMSFKTNSFLQLLFTHDECFVSRFCCFVLSVDSNFVLYQFN